MRYDTVITNVSAVLPESVEHVDIGISDGVIAAVEAAIPHEEAAEVIDGRGLTAFPGAVDTHMHFGIYNPLPEDARSESAAALTGGVTSGLTYIRTGQYYLNRGGPYREFYPEVLRQTAGNSHIDYGYHLAPMAQEHIGEIGDLIDIHGVTSFKIFMFYGGHGLHGRSDDQSSFLMTPPGERYDLAHFEFIMRGIEQAMAARPGVADDVSLSLHCETAEIMTAYTKAVEDDPMLSGLAAYSAARPPHSEGLAVMIAGYLAHETGCRNINLLHLSSAKALEAALVVSEAFPEISFAKEVTIGHLLADIETANGLYAKVNPPIRPREDVEALWEGVLAGDVDWVVSDHACCREEMKLDQADPGAVFLAKSGFGGTEYLLPGLITEGMRRGLSLSRIADLVARNPARRYGLHSKGTIAPGHDADLALVDLDAPWVVRAADSPSTQEYTPFEGFELTARVVDVFLRGRKVLVDGSVVGVPSGNYLRRPSRASGR